MDRPHRQLDREAREEGQPQPLLRLDREIVRHQHRDRRRVRGRHHVDDGDQHQHRAEEGVEEELVARLDTLGAAPDADDQVHRDEAALEEDVEQEQVLRDEHAEHQRFHQHEGRHVFGDAGLDRAPACADADRHQEGGQLDQHQRDPVDAERPADAAADRHVLDELPLRSAGNERRPEVDAEREVDQRRDQRDPARRFGPDEQAQQACDQRDGNQQGEQRERRSSRPPDGPGRRADEAEHHDQRIGIDVARLDAAQ